MSSFISNLLGSSDDGGERRGWRNSLRARGRFTLPQRENTLKETRDLETTECSGHVRDTNVEVFMIDQQSVDKLGQHDNAEDLHDMPYQTGGSSQGLSVDTEAPDGSSSKSLPPKRSSFLAFAGIFRSKTSQLYSGTAQPPSEESPSRKPTVGSDPENYTCINLRGRRALPKDQPEVPIEETPVYSPVVASEAPVLPPIDIRFSPLMVPILLTELEEVKLSRSSSQKVDPLWKRLAKRGFATLSSSDTGPSFQISRPSDENIKEDSYVTADGFEPAPLTPTRLLGIIQRSPLEGDIDMRYLEGRVPSDMISCFAAASASRKPSLSSQSYEADAEDNAVGGRALQGNPKKLHGAERAERYEKMFEHCRVGLSSSEDECVKCRTRSLKESKVDEINQRVEVSVGWTVSCAKDDAGSGKGCLQVDGKTSPKKSVRWSDQFSHSTSSTSVTSVTEEPIVAHQNDEPEPGLEVDGEPILSSSVQFLENDTPNSNPSASTSDVLPPPHMVELQAEEVSSNEVSSNEVSSKQREVAGADEDLQNSVAARGLESGSSPGGGSGSD